MLTILSLKKGAFQKAYDLERVKAVTDSWIDCHNPTEKELELVGTKIGLPLKHFRQYVGGDERPRVINLGKHALLVFRAHVVHDHHITTTSVAFIVGNHCL